MSALGELRKVKNAGAPTTRKQNKVAFFFLLPWFVGLFAITAGPDARIVRTRIHELQPASSRRDSTASTTCVRMFGDERLHKSLGTFTSCSSPCPLQLLLALGPRDAARPGRARARRSTAPCSTCRRCSAAAVAIAVLWRQIFGTEGIVNQVPRPLRPARARAGSPTRAPRCPRSSCSTCGPSAPRW